MEIKKVRNLRRLHNGEHSALSLESLALMEKSDPAAMGVADCVASYRATVEAQMTAMEVFSASALSSEAVKFDRRRDDAYKASRNYVKSFTTSPVEAKRAAAERLMFVFDQTVKNLGNPLKLGYAKETAVLADLLRLLEPLRADIELIGATDQIDELTAATQAFDALQLERSSETASKPSGDVKAARVATDAAFNAVAARINAQALLQGDAAFATYIGEQNAIIDKYSTLAARRKGGQDAAKAEDAPVQGASSADEHQGTEGA